MMVNWLGLTQFTATAVGRGDYDHLRMRVETIHFDQNGVERLLALVMSAAGETGAALATHGVDLIKEDDAGRILLRLLEQIAHA